MKTTPEAPTEPEAVHALFTARFNAGDLEGLLQLYEPTAALVDRDIRIVSGMGDIRAFLGGLLSMRPEMRIRPVRTIRAGDVAVLISAWTLRAVGPDGSAVSDGGTTYDVVRRQEGLWRLVVDNPWGSVLTRLEAEGIAGPAGA
jgi:ketosteroid isomerase-like protein